jgi:flagellin
MGGFSVLNNLSGLIAQQQSSVTQMNLQKTLFKLSTGSRINTGGDDAAGLAIADGLRAQVRSLQQSVRNANDGVGFIQVADSSLGQVTNLLNRAATLLSEAATETVAGNSTALSKIKSELESLFNEIDRVGIATKFNGTDVFSSSSVAVFIGDTTNATSASAAQVSFTVGTLSASGLLTNTTFGGSVTARTITLADADDATAMLEDVKDAIDTVAGKRGDLGAVMNRLENSVSIMQAQIQNLTAAESQIRDADMAFEIANLTKYQILSQVGLAAMAQANAVPQGVLSLLR